MDTFNNQWQMAGRALRISGLDLGLHKGRAKWVVEKVGGGTAGGSGEGRGEQEQGRDINAEVNVPDW